MIHHRFEELKLSGNLPSPSGVGLSILRLTQREDASMEELLWSLQADPALTGRVLKLANQTRDPGEPPCTTVLQAALRVGMRRVRTVALGFTLVTSNRYGVCAPFEYERYWSASLACAVSAQVLARALAKSDPNEAFTLGLLSRVGMLALASVHPDAYAQILRECASRTQAELCAAEHRVFGIDQVEVTAAMLSDWGLPDAFGNAILARAQHAQPAGEADTQVEDLVLVLDLAARFAALLALDRSADPSAFETAWRAIVTLGRVHGASADELEVLATSAARQWKEWGEFLRIPTADRHGFTFSSTEEPAFPRLPELPEEPRASTTDEAAIVVVDRTPIRVLVVDDDAKLARLVGFHLTRAGYQVSSATDGAQALSLVLNESPHIVVTDWMMPSMTGLELCQALRKTEAGRKTYVLILTAKEDEDRIVDAFQAGADDFVTKPFNPRILLARVHAARRLVELQTQVEADKRIREQQMAEMGLLTRRLRAAALTDVLTDLPNRRYAMSRLEQEWDAAQRLARPLSVIMIDIDKFKRINDEFGHYVGDHVLKSTANALRAHTRRGDVVCRLGGEEFLVINVNSDENGALMCAERLRKAVEANTISYEGFQGHVTVSLGLAERSCAPRGIDALLRAADQAVYAAKAAGRNTIRSAEGPDGLSRAG